ncbi:MAG: oligosaccharide flippase family protein [Lachnospiraceae bacterium]
MSGNKKKIATNFAMQATILAVASIVSKLIGMLYNIPFANMLGPVGNGYYGRAQTIYAFILLIATFSIPSAVSKIMAEYIQKGEYKNVNRILKGSMLYVLVVGGIAALFTYFAAPVLVTKNTIPALRILAPTVFISGFLSVYRGYFQAYGNMVPTSVSQIVEQIFNAIFSIGAAVLFMNIATNKGQNADIYGAAGGTLGTGIAALAGLVYITFLFQNRKKDLKENIKLDTSESVMSYKEVIRLLLMIATPIILSSAIYNINVPLDMTIHDKILYAMGTDKELVDGQYGLYSRYYLVLANVPIAMAAAVASAVIPGISAAFAVGNKKECNRKITQSMQLAMTLTVPCAFGFAVLGRQIVALVYYRLNTADNHTVAYLLLFGGFSIVIYGISSVLNGVLQGIGKVNVPVISSLTALVLHILVLVPMLLMGFGTYSLIAATAFYAIVVVFMNYRSVKKELDYHIDWKTILWIPVASSAVMGVAAFVGYKLLFMAMRLFAGEFISNAVSVLLSIGIAAIIYFIAMIKIGGYTKETLSAFPKGLVLVKIASKLHLIK